MAAAEISQGNGEVPSLYQFIYPRGTLADRTGAELQVSVPGIEEPEIIAPDLDPLQTPDEMQAWVETHTPSRKKTVALRLMESARAQRDSLEVEQPIGSTTPPRFKKFKVELTEEEQALPDEQREDVFQRRRLDGLRRTRFARHIGARATKQELKSAAEALDHSKQIENAFDRRINGRSVLI